MLRKGWDEGWTGKREGGKREWETKGKEKMNERQDKRKWE
jgi:hypothetical protein